MHPFCPAHSFPSFNIIRSIQRISAYISVSCELVRYVLIREHVNPMSTKTAFSSWNKRIAPVFDVARQLVLVEIESGRIVKETEEMIPSDDLGEKVRLLAGLGVNALVCGAISRFLHGLVASYGITVVPFVAGDLREVIRAWTEGRLDDGFSMPGCCARSRGRMGRMRRPEQGDSFRKGRPDEELWLHTGAGEHSGQRPGGIRERISSIEREGSCVCPQCGCIEPNHAGIPCLHMRCPRCRSMMIRES